MNSVWVLVPCYFDSESFVELRTRIALVERSLTEDYVFKTVVIDDSSGTDKSLHGLPVEPYTVLTPERHLGHQGALVFGLRSISKEVQDSDFVVTLDCDGEDRPEDIPALLNNLVSRGSDLTSVCVAQRKRRHGTLLFRTCVVIFQIGFQLLTGVRIRHGNFIAFRGAFLKQILNNRNFDVCYSTSVAAVAKDYQSVVLDRGARYAGDSKMSFVTLVGHGVAMAMPFSRQLAVRSLVLAGSGIAVLFALSVALHIRIDNQQTILVGTTIGGALLICLYFLSTHIKSLKSRATALSEMTRRLGVDH